MCFSAEADLVAGAVLLPLGVVSLASVRHPREVPLAALPVLFAAHQLVEVLVWAGLDGPGATVDAGAARTAAWAYVIFALPVLPVLVPVAVWLVADAAGRRRVLPFAAAGVVAAVWLTSTIAANGLRVVEHEHGIEYSVGLGPADWHSTGLYVVAVVGACLVSGHRLLAAFGVVNVVGLTVVGLAYGQAFASLWCVWAALASVLVVAFMRTRRAAPAAPGTTIREGTPV